MEMHLKRSQEISEGILVIGEVIVPLKAWKTNGNKSKLIMNKMKREMVKDPQMCGKSVLG